MKARDVLLACALFPLGGVLFWILGAKQDPVGLFLIFPAMLIVVHFCIDAATRGGTK